MREGVQPGFGRGDADLAQQFEHPRAALAAAEIGVGAQGLVDLPADGEARVEAAHRLLEDHRHVAADELPAGAGERVRRSCPSKARRSAVTRPGRRIRPITASMATDLAGAALADEAEHVAGVDVEVEAVDGGHAGRARCRR